MMVLRCLSLRSPCPQWPAAAGCCFGKCRNIPPHCLRVSDKISWLRVSCCPTTNNLPQSSQSFTELGKARNARDLAAPCSWEKTRFFAVYLRDLRALCGGLLPFFICQKIMSLTCVCLYPVLVHRTASSLSLPSDDTSRCRPCDSLALHLHQVGRRTCTSK
jgi:hypothetical protein